MSVLTPQIIRKDLPYVNMSPKFIANGINYQKQFSHFYSFRLREMTKLLTPKVHEMWGNEIPIKKLCELREESQDNCIIIGTLFKHQAFKPSILREISEENQLAPQPQRLNYSEPDDKLILEDELQRVRILGKVDTRYMATGVVCAVKGNVEEDGTFYVEDIMFYESGPQKSMSANHSDTACYIALISGLDQVQSHQFADSLNLFQHWLSGNIRTGTVPANVVRLIIAGNSVRSMAEVKTSSLLKSAEPANTVTAVKELDRWFSRWSQTISIDVMPGEFDPANFMLPQQPFHRCMFPESVKNSTFRSVTNPYACEVGDCLIVGTSGQNIKDIMRSTFIDDPLEALRSSLKWSHISPTSPDTLGCYPFIDNDPFIMDKCPHIYFSGNCSKFRTALHTGSSGQRTRLVCVPAFSTACEIAIVNLHNLECSKISFQI